jgi:hypothetical protein
VWRRKEEEERKNTPNPSRRRFRGSTADTEGPARQNTPRLFTPASYHPPPVDMNHKVEHMSDDRMSSCRPVLVYLENVTIDGTRYENVMENVMKSDENVIDENVIT